MADNITIDLDTATDEQIKKLQRIGFSGNIEKKLEIHTLTDEKVKLQEQLNVINERLAELRK